MSITTEFLRRPLMTGAVAASSQRLARAMTEGIGLEGARLVVELGPGSGVFTDAILRRLAPGARLVAIELNPTLAARLSATRRDTRLTVVTGSATELAATVGEPVDAVVSGLPWTVMPRERRGRILDAVTHVLAPEGRFTTFAYVHAARTPPARHFAAELACRFDRLERTSVVWRNLPPAFVHRATRPLDQQGGLKAAGTQGHPADSAC
ncbi:class I SAM-dependent methyltransferase [Streptomyces sp. NPDC092369]|uniref:class I SAM-dependent methyltransferase n=1 Tax=Streptomyces sp. NPDC092369 TaxID=3366015 RepID=UPI00380E7A42